MAMPVDFHVHSTNSDGTLTQEQLLRNAKESNIRFLSFTDHDTYNICEDIADLRVIPGIELSIQSVSGELHLLGYNFDVTSKSIIALTKELQQRRRERFSRLLSSLSKKGIQLSADDFAMNGNKSPGRPHVARFLVEHGYVDSVADAFATILAPSPSFSHNKISIEEGIAAITDGGGISCLAHPVSLEMKKDDFCVYLDHLKKLGLGAIEVFHPLHSDEAVDFYLECAARFNLFVSGGSDFHDPECDELACYGEGRILDGALFAPFLDRLGLS